MAKSDHASFLLADFDATRNELRLRSLGTAPFSRFDIHLPLDAKAINAECRTYWSFVDAEISNGTLTKNGDQGLKIFYDELITFGAKLCRALFDRDARQKVWALAKQSTAVIIITNLLHVPWEALFDPETRSFLSDACVIVRWPQATADLTHEPAHEISFEKQRVVCLDPVLAADTTIRIEGSCIIEALREHFGDDLHLTSMKGALVQQVRSTRLVQWICEHATEGLRIADSVFYTTDDTEAHPFPEGSILVLTSCKSGAEERSAHSVAAAICAASHCTVIAPSSVVATTVGVQFARKLDRLVRESADPLNVAQLWRTLHVPHKDIEEGLRELTAEGCFALWYGIYGNGEADLR